MQLKRYAEIQKNITTWKTDEAGYVLNGSALSDRWWESEGFDGTNIIAASLTVSNLIAFIIAPAVLYIIHTKSPKLNPNLGTESEKKRNKSFFWFNSVHWITVAVMAQFNIMFLSADFAQAVNWCQSHCEGVAFLKMFWFIYLLFFLLFSLILTFFRAVRYPIGIQNYKYPSGIEVWNILVCAPCAIFSIFGSCFLYNQKKRNSLCTSENNRASKCVRYLFCAIYFPTIYVFISLILSYLLPVLFLLLVYPFKVIPAYSFLIAALVLYILIAAYGDYKRKLWSEARRSHTSTICVPSFYLMMALLNVMFIAIMMVLFIVAYKALMAGGLSDNPVLHSFFSFLPSIILSALIWLFKNKVINKSAEDGTTQNTSTDEQQPSESDTSDENNPVLPEDGTTTSTDERQPSESDTGSCAPDEENTPLLTNKQRIN